MTGQPERPATTQQGYEIFKDKFIPGDNHQRAGWVIVAFIPMSYHPWVTWWMDVDGNCQGGNYFMTQDEAEVDFEGRR